MKIIRANTYIAAVAAATEGGISKMVCVSVCGGKFPAIQVSMPYDRVGSSSDGGGHGCRCK